MTNELVYIRKQKEKAKMDQEFETSKFLIEVNIKNQMGRCGCQFKKDGRPRIGTQRMQQKKVERSCKLVTERQLKQSGVEYLLFHT